MNDIQLMMITANPAVARYAELNGVGRIFIDQETLGKHERQGHLNTHKAAHTVDDIRQVAAELKSAELMVRVNPLNPRSREEVEAAIENGCTRLMLPMFQCRNDVERFVELVDRRVPISFLAETPASVIRVSDWIDLLLPGRDEIHIGLNDLSLGMGLNFLFEPLAGRMLEPVKERCEAAGIAWGFGGIAQLGKGELPAELVLSEHIRLGSSRVILSRAFHQNEDNIDRLHNELNFAGQIQKLRALEKTLNLASAEELRENQRKLAQKVFYLANRAILEKSGGLNEKT